MSIEQAYQILYMGVIIVLLVLIGIMLIRSIIGPRIADRIMAVNMIGTMVISIIAILSVKMDEGYLGDVAMIYAMISFVAVLMAVTMFIKSHPDEPDFSEDPDPENDKKHRHHKKNKKKGGNRR